MTKLPFYPLCLLIVSLSTLALPWADDFCSLEMLKEHSPWSYAKHIYQYWDGRLTLYLTLGFFFQNFFTVKVLLILLAVIFILKSYFLLKLTFPFW